MYENKELMQLHGIFVRFNWRDEKSGKSLFWIKIPDKPVLKEMYYSEKAFRDSITKEERTWYTISCVAMQTGVAAFAAKTPVVVTGYFVENKDKKYSWNFIVVSAREESSGASEIVDFLLSDQFSGIMYKDACTIAKYIDGQNVKRTMEGKPKTDLFDFLQSDTAINVLSEQTAINITDIHQLINKVTRLSVERKLFQNLSPYGISYTESIKLIKLYGKEAENRLKADPYEAGTAIGMSYEMCDKLCKELGYPETEPIRAKTIILESMRQAHNNGHIWVRSRELWGNIGKVLKNSAYEKTELNTSCILPFSKNVLRYEGGRFYDNEMYKAETQIVDELLRIHNACKNIIEPFSPDLIESASKVCGMPYGRQQQNAFPVMLQKRGFKILIGGPGTGKTTTIKGILFAYKQMHPNHIIKLCAPTGRAAQRMAESTGCPATTIHRLLNIRPTDNGLAMVASGEKIEADLIVVDEVSMLDTTLCYDFLKAVKNGTTVIFVGDTNQLESVGPGSVLHDLLTAPFNIVQRAVLTEVFRQGADSPIIQNALNINEGRSTLLETPDFHTINVKNAEDIMKIVTDLSEKLYDPKDPFGTQILCPAHKGTAGIGEINKKLQKLLNPTREFLKYGYNEFKVGDKILMTTNNYELGYYNGDIGIVKSIKDHGLVLDIRNEIIRIEKDLLGHVQLAYGMTIHKSQGSEFQNVIIVMPKEPASMLVRNLIYTGVTRAKKKVWIIDEQNALDIACKTNHTGCRNTTLGIYMSCVTPDGKIDKEKLKHELHNLNLQLAG